MHKVNPILLKSVLIFVLGGILYVLGVKHFLLPDTHGHVTSISHFLTMHIPDFIFVILAGVLLYRMLYTSYQRLSDNNKELQEREKKILSRELEIESLYDRERYLRSIMSVVRDVNAYLLTAKDIDELGKMSCKRLTRNSDYRLVWIGLIEDNAIVVKYYSTDLTGYLDFQSLAISDKDSTINCPICQAIKEDQTIIINELNDPNLPEKLRAAVENGIFTLISLPLKARKNSHVIGVVNIYSSNEAGFSVEEVAMLEELAGDIGFAIHAFKEEDELRRLEKEKLQNYEQTLFSMIDLIESRDTYTAGHTQRVAQYCSIIAEAMGYTPHEIKKLHKAAMLHDIGKIQTPDAILLKPGKLGDYEYELIQEHVTTGYNMLYKIDMYKELAEIMRHHHEHYDGSGYPDGLRGDEIPLLAHIMIVADAFDAMTTSRIYKPRMSLENALSELQRCSGTQFHPDIIKVAIKVLADLPLKTVHQLPLNRVENERISYYYKDRLTGTFNYDYLPVVLNNTEIFGKYRYICTILLKNFTQINKELGWAHGDLLLEAFGNYLKNTAKEGIVFRRHGDDFLILSKILFPCNVDTIRFSPPLIGSNIDVHLTQFDLEKENVYTIDELEVLLTAHTPV